MSIKFTCTTPGCRQPWAEIYNGVISIPSRHGGEHHTNAMAVTDMLAILDMSAARREAWKSIYDISAIHNVRAADIQLPAFSASLHGIEFVCNRGECTKPWGYAIDGLLYIEAYHGGAHHINAYSVADLRTILGEVYLERLIRRGRGRI